MPIVAKSRASLQDATLFVAQGRVHHAFASKPLLSIKCMFNGTALYRVSRALFAVDETGYLVLNHEQAYEIEINSPTRLESFIVFFPDRWATEVLRSLSLSTDHLLDDPEGNCSESIHFFERLTPHDDVVSPALAKLRSAHQRGPLSDLWVEERLRDLLARVLQSQRGALGEADVLPACRAASRHELWRRLNRARDFIRAQAHLPLTVFEIASAASLSPFHFLRSFKTLFGQTPHQFLAGCRSERACFLLERTELPVTEICFDVGFESLGAFSSWFRALKGRSPREWRQQAARAKKQF
jgi:AraC-like DNA-binding protein